MLLPPRVLTTISFSFSTTQVDNFAPNSTTQPIVAAQIANFLKSPDIVFLQEIQDNSGPADDGVVAADVTLRTLIAGIRAAGSTATYNFTEVISVNDEDGGEPGGNIRPAYL